MYLITYKKEGVEVKYFLNAFDMSDARNTATSRHGSQLVSVRKTSHVC